MGDGIFGGDDESWLEPANGNTIRLTMCQYSWLVNYDPNIVTKLKVRDQFICFVCWLVSYS